MIVDLYVYQDKSSPTTQVWENFFCEYLPNWKLRLCFADELIKGDTQHVIFPGGSGSAFYKNLCEYNSSRVIEWVLKGGSYIGVCAGAYLASNHLKITPLVIPDKAWERGLHDVEISIKGVDHIVNYHNGPIFENSTEVEVWAVFKSNILAEGSFIPMEKSPAITHNSYGDGIVTLFSPHLEKSSSEIKKKMAKLFKYINRKKYSRK